MTIEFILSQVFICVSACIYSTSLILKTKQKMLMLQMCSSIFFISHYFLLDEKLAGFVAVLETIRLLAFFYLDKHEKYNTTLTRSITCIIFSVLSVIAAIFTWNSIYCLLPLIAILVGIEFLLILPFDLIKTKKQKQSQIEELIALGNLKEQQEFRKKHKTSKSQILVRSETKATPQAQKNVRNSSDDGFVATTKEVKINKEHNDTK